MERLSWLDRKKKEKTEDETRRYSHLTRRLSVISLCVSVAGLVLTAVMSTFTAYEANRAWVNVIGAEIAYPPQDQHPFHYQLDYINTGREPAIDLTFAEDHFLVDAPPTADDFSSIKIPENHTCDHLQPEPGVVAYPSFGGDVVLKQGMDSSGGENPINFDQSLLTGRKFLVALGCISYKSFWRVHKSGWCIIFQTNLTEAPRSVDASHREESINPPAETREVNNKQLQLNVVPLRCNRGFLAT